MGLSLSFADRWKEQYPNGYAEITQIGIQSASDGSLSASVNLNVWNTQDDFSNGIEPKQRMSLDVPLADFDMGGFMSFLEDAVVSGSGQLESNGLSVLPGSATKTSRPVLGGAGKTGL